MLRCSALIAAGLALLAASAARADETFPVMHPEPIFVRVLNGKDGKPLSHAHLLLVGGYDPEELKMQTWREESLTDEHGSVRLSNQFANLPFLQVWVLQQKTCQANPRHDAFSIERIRRDGLSAPNRCGTATANATPGVFTVFVKGTLKDSGKKGGWLKLPFHSQQSASSSRSASAPLIPTALSAPATSAIPVAVVTPVVAAPAVITHPAAVETSAVAVQPVAVETPVVPRAIAVPVSAPTAASPAASGTLAPAPQPAVTPVAAPAAAAKAALATRATPPATAQPPVAMEPQLVQPPLTRTVQTSPRPLVHRHPYPPPPQHRPNAAAPKPHAGKPPMPKAAPETKP
jgi:hypothetical protein